MSPAPTRTGSPSAVVTARHVKSRVLTRRAQTRSAGAGDFHLWAVLLRPPHVQSVGPLLRAAQGLPASRTLLRPQHALRTPKSTLGQRCIACTLHNQCGKVVAPRWVPTVGENTSTSASTP